MSQTAKHRPILGCDIGNGFGYVSLLQQQAGDPLPLLPSKYQLSNLGMPTTAYVTPPDGTPIVVFQKGKAAEKRYQKYPKQLVHAVKTRLKDGTVAYTVGRSVVASEGEDVGERGEAQMSRVLNGLVTSVAAAGNLVVVHTPSGAAQYVASVIDKQPIEGVLGTIAGDDTVMVICTNDDTAVSRSDWLLSLASK